MVNLNYKILCFPIKMFFNKNEIYTGFEIKYCFGKIEYIETVLKFMILYVIEIGAYDTMVA